jgi:putative FmdB family regulatory protein
MPLYTFVCARCDHIFDVRASIKAREAGLHPVCPHCNDQEVTQVITAPGLLAMAPAGETGPAACGPGAGWGCCG